MAGRIPEITRRKLASTVTGTQGADLSTARALSTIGNEVGKFADRTHREDVARQKQTHLEDVARQKQTAAQSAKTQAARDTVSANRTSAQYNAQLNHLRSTSNSPEEFNDAAQKLFDDTLDGLGSDESKAKFSTRASTYRVSQSNIFSGDHERNKIEKVETDLDGIIKDQSEHIYSLFSDPDMAPGLKMVGFGATMAAMEQGVKDAKGLLKAESHADYQKKSKIALVRAGISALIDFDPGSVETFIKAANAVGLISQEEIEASIDQANNMARKKTELRNRTEKAEGSNRESDMFLQLTSGKPIPERDLIEAGFAKELTATQVKFAREANARASRMFKGDHSFTYNELVKKFMEMPLAKPGFLGPSGVGFLPLDSGSKKLTKAEKEKKNIESQAERLKQQIIHRGVAPSAIGSSGAGQKAMAKAQKGEGEELDLFFAQLSRQRQRVMEAHEKGELDDKEANALLKLVNPVFRKGAEGVVDELIRKQTFIKSRPWLGLFGGGLKRDPNVVDLTAAELDTARKNFTTDLMQRIDAAENAAEANGDDELSNAQMVEIYHDAVDDLALRSTSDKAQYKLWDLVPLDNGGQVQVVGFELNGKAMIEDDPSEFVLKDDVKKK